MRDELYKLFLISDNRLTKDNINSCNYVPSYNTILRNGYSLVDLNKEFNEEYYRENPKKCMECNSIIPYVSNIKNLKFCNKSCSAKYNNKLYVKKTKINKSCKQCEKILAKSQKKYCSSKCQNENQYSEYIKKWLQGEEAGTKGKSLGISNYIRRYIYDTFGSNCSQCGWDDRHPIDGKILTEIDHIDGQADNNNIKNLRVLCPNCHSKTSTFKNRNTKSKRKR